jgi:hypothetical protein
MRFPGIYLLQDDVFVAGVGTGPSGRRPRLDPAGEFGPAGGLLGGTDPTGRAVSPCDQSSLRMVPVPRLVVNSELPPLPNRSR